MTPDLRLMPLEETVKLLVGYFLKFVAWVVEGYLKITGQWISQDDYRRIAANVRHLAREFHLDHYPVVLDEGDGRQCSECKYWVEFVVEPHGLCSPCWMEGLEQTQRDLREAVGA